MRYLIAGVAAAMAIGASSATAQTADWRESILVLGWDFVTADATQATLSRPAPGGTASTKRVWMRFEFLKPQADPKPYKSMTALMEIACSTAQMRTLQSERYPQNNLGGAADEDAAVTAWSYIIPGSIGEGVSAGLCQPAAATPKAAPSRSSVVPL